MAGTVVILNPKAGSVREITSLTKRLRDLPDTEVLITTGKTAATRFARKAVERGCDTIVAAGGDGTLNEVLNGMAADRTRVRLGLIPLGTGNDFARTIGLPTDFNEAIDVLTTGRDRAIDLVRVTSKQVRYFINVSAGGFSGLVDEKLTPKMKKAWGPLAYLRCAVAALPQLHAYRTAVSFGGGKRLNLDVYNVIVANGRYAGGGTMIAPRASINDGLLDVILILERPATDLALLAAQVALGKHLSSKTIVFQRAAKVRVKSRPGMWFNVDGELVGNDPVTFEVLPRALRFVVPRRTTR